jgi:membrane fusion protein, multidrug efflux system
VLGPAIDGLRVVRQGLEPGDQVIVNGLQKVFFPGMPVAPEVVAMRAAADPRVAAAGGQ